VTSRRLILAVLVLVFILLLLYGLFNGLPGGGTEDGTGL
jgi:hypothetical protein